MIVPSFRDISLEVFENGITNRLRNPIEILNNTFCNI